MRKLLIAAVVAGSMVTAGVFASNTIGVIDVKKIISQSHQLQSASKSMQAKFGPMQNNLKKETATFQANVKNFQKNSSTMSKADVAKEQQKLQAEQSAVMSGQSKLRQQAMAGQQSAMSSFMTSLKAATAVVAKQKGLTLVLPNNAVVYSADDMDITSAVLDQLNK